MNINKSTIAVLQEFMKIIQSTMYAEQLLVANKYKIDKLETSRLDASSELIAFVEVDRGIYTFSNQPCIHVSVPWPQMQCKRPPVLHICMISYRNEGLTN